MFEERRPKSFFGYPLETGAKYIGIGNCILSLVEAIVSGILWAIAPEELERQFIGFQIFVICFSTIVFFLSILLVYGVKQDKRIYMLPWLIIKFGTFEILFWAFLVSIFIQYIPFEIDKHILTIVFLPFIVFFIYCWGCVMSHYIELRKKFQFQSRPRDNIDCC